MILGIVMILWYIHHMIFVLRERLGETEKERKRRKRMMFEDLIFNHILSKQVLKIFSLPTFSVFIRETPLILCTLVSLKPCFVYIVLNPKWTQTHSALVFSCAFIVVKRKPEMFFFSLTEIFICKYPLTGLLPKKNGFWVSSQERIQGCSKQSKQVVDLLKEDSTLSRKWEQADLEKSDCTQEQSLRNLLLLKWEHKILRL